MGKMDRTTRIALAGSLANFCLEGALQVSDYHNTLLAWFLLFCGLSFAAYAVIHHFRRDAVHSDLVLLKPTSNRYAIHWDPPREMQIVSKQEIGNGTEYIPGLPIFGIKNLGLETARDISISWTFEEWAQLKSLVNQSARLSRFNPIFGNEDFSVFASDQTSPLKTWTVTCRGRSTSPPILILAPQSETLADLPFDVYSSAEILFAAILPNERMPAYCSAHFAAKMKWSTPTGNASEEFLITAIATNRSPEGPQSGVRTLINGELRPPYEMMASVHFRVKLMRDRSIPDPPPFQLVQRVSTTFGPTKLS
jgi:hypothetical protein